MHLINVPVFSLGVFEFDSCLIIPLQTLSVCVCVCDACQGMYWQSFALHPLSQTGWQRHHKMHRFRVSL